MSAFVVNPEHIGMIAAWAIRLPTMGREYRTNCYFYQHSKSEKMNLNSPEDLAELLANANIDSVNFRYQNSRPDVVEDMVSGDIQRTEYVSACRTACGRCAEHVHKVDATMIWKMLSCLEYQSCERPDWYESDAYHAIKAIREHAGDQMAESAEVGHFYLDHFETASDDDDGDANSDPSDEPEEEPEYEKERSLHVAEVIRQQIGLIPWGAWGSRKPTLLHEPKKHLGGLQWRVTGIEHTGCVQVSLSFDDTYCVRTIKRYHENQDTFEKRIKSETKGVYCDQLVDVLDKMIDGSTPAERKLEYDRINGRA